MNTNIKIEIPKDLKSDIQKFGNNIAKNIALAARDAITTEYAIAIEEFYNAYTPLQYERKWQLRKPKPVEPLILNTMNTPVISIPMLQICPPTVVREVLPSSLNPGSCL